jgi:2-amino-4-hydroxy-6-hydroxymethyldihydropteridine diphosphokinase
MILIALGSNLEGPWGTPRQTLLRALEELSLHNIRVTKVSTLIETAPFGVLDQPNFVNAVAEIETGYQPEALMQILHAVENGAGRKRVTRWGPRTLDLDLLDYNGLILNTELKLPHPGITERDFVLGPIDEIAPHWTHPITGKTAALTLRELRHLNGD